MITILSKLNVRTERIFAHKLTIFEFHIFPLPSAAMAGFRAWEEPIHLWYFYGNTDKPPIRRFRDTCIQDPA
jgi:hypothetical protein